MKNITTTNKNILIPRNFETIVWKRSLRKNNRKEIHSCIAVIGKDEDEDKLKCTN